MDETNVWCSILTKCTACIIAFSKSTSKPKFISSYYCDIQFLLEEKRERRERKRARAKERERDPLNFSCVQREFEDRLQDATHVKRVMFQMHKASPCVCFIGSAVSSAMPARNICCFFKRLFLKNVKCNSL